MKLRKYRVVYDKGGERTEEGVGKLVSINFVFCQLHVIPEDGVKSRNIYIVFLVFHFCDTHLEISLISINMYHLVFTPDSYKLISFSYFKFSFPLII